MIQSKEELDRWYLNADPWGYGSHPDDAMRRSLLLSEIPPGEYKRVLDIGCGNGFITFHLPGREIIGVDVSATALEHARNEFGSRCSFVEGSIFDVVTIFPAKSFDLVVITGVLYDQYIGKSLDLIYLLIDNILSEGGVLACVHIDQWYRGRFPYLLVSSQIYEYREYLHRLEIYVK